MSISDQLNHFKKLMKKVANRKELCDVNLVAGKGRKKFPVHRLIMSVASKYFDALLGPNFREGSDYNIVLQDIDGATLKSIINYIYCGEITINHRNVCAIAAASSWMQLIELEKRCAEFGENDLNAENCIEVLVKANEHHLVGMKSKAFDMICANFGKLSIDKIAKIDETTYRELLSCDQLPDNETHIFNGLVRWLAINKAEEDDSIPEFLKLIRLRHISKQILMETVEPFFVKHNQWILIFDEYRRRLLDSKKTFGSCRWSPKDIHLVSTITEASVKKMIFTKYDSDADEWVEIKKKAVNIYYGSMVVANDILYVMGRKASMNGCSRAVCAYDLKDFTRIKSRHKIERWSECISVVVGNFIYVFGGEEDLLSCRNSSCERFDIERGTWTTRNNMPIHSSSRCVAAIEHNGTIHVGIASISSHRSQTQLYCYNPVDDTWQLKAEIANPVVFAKTSSSLYVIEHDRVLHHYDPIKAALTKIGEFDFNGYILHTIELGDEIYLMGDVEFVKLNLEQNVEAIKLKMVDSMNPRCLYLK